MEQPREAQRAQNHANLPPPQIVPNDNNNNNDNELPQVCTCCVCTTNLHEHPNRPHRAHPANQFKFPCNHSVCCECACNLYVHACTRVNPLRLNLIQCPMCRAQAPVRPSYFIRLYRVAQNIEHDITKLQSFRVKVTDDANARHPNLGPGPRAQLLTRLDELLLSLQNNDIANLGRLNNARGPVRPSDTPLLLLLPPQPVAAPPLPPVNPPPQQVIVPPGQPPVNPPLQQVVVPPPQQVVVPPLPLAPLVQVPGNDVQILPPPIVQNAPVIAPMVVNHPQVNIPEAHPLPLPPHVQLPIIDDEDPEVEFFNTYSQITYTTVYTLRNVFDIFPWNLSFSHHAIIYLSLILSIFHPLYAVPVLLCNLTLTKETIIAVSKLLIVFTVMSLFTLPAFTDDLSPTEAYIDIYTFLQRFLIMLRVCFRYYKSFVVTAQFTYIYCSGVSLMYITPLLRIGSASNHGMIKPHEHDLIGLPVWLPDVDYQYVPLLNLYLPVFRFAHMPPSITGGLQYTGHVTVGIYEPIYLKLINNRYANVPTSELLRYIAGDVANLFLENRCTMNTFDPMKLLYTQFAIYQAVLTVRSCEREITVTPAVSSIRDIQW